MPVLRRNSPEQHICFPGLRISHKQSRSLFVLPWESAGLCHPCPASFGPKQQGALAERLSQGAPLTTGRLLAQLGEPQVSRKTGSVALGSPATLLAIPDGLESRNMAQNQRKAGFSDNAISTHQVPHLGGVAIRQGRGANIPARSAQHPEIEEATQDIKTADATLQILQHEEIAILQNEHQPSAMKAIVNALVAIVALLLALFGYGIGNAPAEEESQIAAAVKKVSLERQKAVKRIKRAEAHMRALDRLVEAQQLDIGDNGTGSWEMLER
ncbi:hypothetical protein FGLOB1_11974 [Fusarium globosum]|uniref:Uncharacterized protein n=1 Tax=Fusarium globosum TaxID=78864 RepID=A0A8H6D095_9HYPO|nr:hypothetical protein FGLOB1_11974 [Fusarium globosum]